MVRKIEVVPYDPDWVKQFEAEAVQLRALLGKQVLAIHHAGSTAVPGMSAKPIVDLLMVVQDVERLDGFNCLMIQRGYHPMGEYGIPGRRFFFKGSNEQRTHHLHAFGEDSPEIERHLLFRDYLRAHPADAKTYSDLKVRVAREFSEDINGYMAGKHDLIQKLEGRARAWKAAKEEQDN